MSLLVLSAADVAQVTRSLSALALCDMLGATMNAVSNRQSSPRGVSPIQNPQRISTESEIHTTLYMPSRLTTRAQGPATSIKVVAAPKPECPVPGLPATTLLMDESSGRVSAIVNASELTGIRTAAASALATKILADPGSKTLAVFGSGTQAYYHARLILELFPSLESAHFIVRKPSSRSETLLARMEAEFPRVGFAISVSDGASAVVQSADVICACVPSTTPLFAPSDLKPGVHINAIGSYTPSMFEFPPALICPTTSSEDSTKIPAILVDSREACLHEAGELIASGIGGNDLVEIGELCDEQGQLRTDSETHARVIKLGGEPTRRSLFKSVGVGAMDVAITRMVVDEAKRRGFGTLVEF